MIRFELSKKASDKIRRIAAHILVVQEERCPVVKTQMKLAMRDPQFAGLVAQCRDSQATFAERDAAWEKLMELLPSKRLDFDSMRQDALSYYGDDSDEVEHGMVFEVVRETYDLMWTLIQNPIILQISGLWDAAFPMAFITFTAMWYLAK